MVKHKSISTEENYVPDFQSQFSSSVSFGNPIQHSVASAECQVVASMTPQPVRSDRRMHCLHICNAAEGCWQDIHTWIFDNR